MQVYGDHIELEDGTLVPGPGSCHPALEGCRDAVLSSRHDWETVKVPVTMDPPVIEESTSMYLNYTTLTFTPYRIRAIDEYGVTWQWTVWIDQYKRGIGSKAKQYDPG